MRLRWRSTLTSIGLVVFLLIGPTLGAAHAHVTVDSARLLPDSRTEVTLSFKHGCGKSPTTELAVQFPPGSDPQSLSQPEGWQTVTVPGDQAQVRWEGPAIPDGEQVWFSASAELQGAPGQSVLLPSIQKCANGETFSWSDPDPNAAEPAPTLLLTQALLPAASPSEQTPGTVGLFFLAGVVVLVAAFVGAVAYVLEKRR